MEARKFFSREVPKGSAIELDIPVGGVVEPCHHLGQGAFPAPGASNHGQGLAGFEFKGDVVEGAYAGVGVGESHAFEAKLRPWMSPTSCAGIWEAMSGRTSRKALILAWLAEAFWIREVTQPMEAKGQVNKLT